METPDANNFKKFSVEEQFNIYLKLVNLDKRKMPPFQLREMRRCFYGAVGQTLILLRDEVVTQDEDSSINSVQDLLDQINEFWIKESSPKN